MSTKDPVRFIHLVRGVRAFSSCRGVTGCPGQALRAVQPQGDEYEWSMLHNCQATADQSSVFRRLVSTETERVGGLFYCGRADESWLA